MQLAVKQIWLYGNLWELSENFITASANDFWKTEHYFQLIFNFQDNLDVTWILNYEHNLLALIFWLMHNC